MTEDEKSYWRIHAALQEILRVTDEDVEKNPLLKQLLHSVTFVARQYRVHGAEAVRQDTRDRTLTEMGIPVIKPKKKKK